MFNTVRGAASLSLLANVILVVLKLGVGLAIGSISVLSDALDSGIDLIGALVALAAVTLASRPADREHPYGHGKIESVSGIVEAGLITIGAGLITFEAIRRLVQDTDVGSVSLGILAMSISTAINIGLSFHLRRVARATNSPALAAAAWHRTSDILTSAGVLVGLILIQTTPWDFLDPVAALGVAAVIAITGFRVFWRALHELLDVRLPEEEEAKVRTVLDRDPKRFVEYHSLRTRRSGRLRVVDLHMVVPRTMTVAKAHELTDEIEVEIEQALPNTLTTIHVEPCDIPEAECDAQCPLAESPHCYQVAANRPRNAYHTHR